jgi:hypothetical protein
VAGCQHPTLPRLDGRRIPAVRAAATASRHRRTCPHRSATAGRRAGRALPGRYRQPHEPDDPGAHGLRPHSLVAPLGNTQSRQAPALDDRLTRVSIPSGALRAAASQPPLPPEAGWATTAPQRKGASPQQVPQPGTPQRHNEVIGAPRGTCLARTSRAQSRRHTGDLLGGGPRRVVTYGDDKVGPHPEASNRQARSSRRLD